MLPFSSLYKIYALKHNLMLQLFSLPQIGNKTEYRCSYIPEMSLHIKSFIMVYDIIAFLKSWNEIFKIENTMTKFSRRYFLNLEKWND
jgi:hypothetical protein